MAGTQTFKTLKKKINLQRKLRSLVCELIFALQKQMATKKKTLLVLPIVLIILILLGAFSYIAKKVSEADKVLAPSVALIEINGEIGADYAADLVKLIKKADKDSQVKAIVFEINSPGGTVLASKEIANTIKEAKKPTVAWIREVGASGAYWVASAADNIVADETSIVGSIGVIGSYLQFAGLFDKYGITYERLVSGQYKDAGSPYKELTGEEKNYLQSKIFSLKQLFVAAVAENRDLDEKYVNSLATGEIFLGSEALKLKLIDELGGKQEAQKAAEKLAKLKESRLVKYEAEKGVFDLLSQQAEAVAYWVGRGIGDSFAPKTSNKIEFVAEI